VLGGILLLAAALKALDPVAFGEEITAQGVTFGLPPFVAALVALAIELAIGLALVLGLRSHGWLLAASLLVAFFLFLTGRAAWLDWRGLEPPSSACGCFGSLVERTPTEAFVQDLALLVPALALAWVGRPGASKGRAARRIGVIAGTAAGVAFAAAAPGLPLDDVATRLRPGTELEALCAGAGEKRVCLTALAPALAVGEHLVVLDDAAGERFAAEAPRLSAYARSGEEPALAVLSDLTPEQQQEIYWSVAPAFDLHVVPAALLRPLYRRLPRSFRVANGRVVETWDGLPPALPAEAPASRGLGLFGDDEP